MTGAVRDADTRKRYNGRGKRSNIMNTGVNPNVNLRMENLFFHAHGEVYSLTKGLLMDDPFGFVVVLPLDDMPNIDSDPYGGFTVRLERLVN
jgi:hypothetical protein